MADIDDEDVPSYPVPQARMQQFQANSRAAGAGGVPGGPLSQGVAPVAAAPLSANPYGLGGGYAQLYALAQQQAQEQQKARQAYLASLQQQESALGEQGMSGYDKAALLFQAAGALGQTTRSGGFGETLGNLGTAMAGPLSKEAEKQRARAQQLQQLQLARQKLAMEMAGTGQPSISDTVALMKAQQEAQPKLTDTQKLLQDPSLSPEDRKAGLRKALKLDETEKETKEDVKTVTRPDGTQFSIVRRGGRSYDPITNEPIDETKIAATAATAQTADRENHALELGVPILPRDPYANLQPKDREKARTARYNADSRILQKQAEEVPDAVLRNEIADLRRFVVLNNENRSTGYIYGKTPNITPSAQQMAEIESKLTIGAGKDLKGAASDRDVRMFGNAVPSTSKDFEANVNIAKFNEMKNRTELERREFMRDYLSVNKTLDGADRKWNQYLNDNPFFKYPDKFNPNKLDITKLKKNNERLSYQEYFRKELSGGATPVVRDEQGRLIIRE